MLLPTDITLEPGSSGDHVAELQRRLVQRDLLGEGNINSSYDGPTEQAVRSFQGMNGILTDGIAGPRTLRMMTNIGSSSEGSGGESSEEQEEEKAPNEERHDDLALEAQMDEQEKLSNEAVWGQNQEAQQQLSDLDRYNDQYEQDLALHEHIESELQGGQQQAMQEGLDHQRSSEHELDQLTIDQEGMKASTLMEELDNEQISPETGQSQDQAFAQEGHGATTQESTIDRLDDAPLHEAPIEPELPQQQPEAEIEQSVEPEAPALPRDPELLQTEAQLDGGSQVASTQEGHSLEKKGIKNQGQVPMAELGQLTPSQTPGQQREREIGIG